MDSNEKFCKHNHDELLEEEGKEPAENHETSENIASDVGNNGTLHPLINGTILFIY